jgi:hypothetical protein
MPVVCKGREGMPIPLQELIILPNVEGNRINNEV